MHKYCHNQHQSAFTLLEVALVLAGLSLLTAFSTEVAAFTLIELSMVLVVISLLGALVFSKMTQDTRAVKTANMQAKMDKIQRALQNFARQNNRLPCPADGRQAQATSATFGMETAPVGDCTNAASYTNGASPTTSPAANFYNGSDTVGGVVPVRTLAAYGLTDNDILDEWNNELGYFVSRKATVTNAFTIYKNNTAFGTIKVNDGSGNYRTQTALALILSYGSSGHGAYQINGIEKIANISNTDALANCHCQTNGTTAVGGFTSTFVTHPSTQTSNSDPSTRFDDIVRYLQPEFFASAPDSAPDTPPVSSPDAAPDALPAR